jgi:hypothetical protein
MSRKPRSENGQTAVAKTPEERQAERRARFLRLCEKRVEAAIKRLGHVGRLGNRQTYSYTDDEADAIMSALVEALEQVRDSFSRAEKPVGPLFRLPASS